MQGIRSRSKHIHLPWIHKRDPLAFHSIKVLLSMNHAAVPARRAVQKKSWFIEGSGGDIQFWIFFCSLSPGRYCRSQKQKMWKKKNRRFSLFLSFNVFWRATTTPSQLWWYLFHVRHILISCRILSVDASPSNETNPQENICEWSSEHSAPCITTLT